MKVPSDIFLTNTDEAANNGLEYILRLEEAIRETFNIARKHI